jgi:sugar phosphate isomerase/epimerase
MTPISRRHFLAAAGLSAAAVKLPADPLGLPIGFQSWPVRREIAADFPGTLKQLAAVGYQAVEMCSPPGYVNYGFGPLTKYSASEIRHIIQDAGLRCESCHFGFPELNQHLDERIAWSKELGLRQMVLSAFNLPRDASLDDWKRAADTLNSIADKITPAGIQAGYHNHDFEFKKFGDVLVYDELMRRFDPKLIKMQFQVAVISLGYHASTYLTKYPGRFLSLHLADWSPAEKKEVPIGKGVVDWPQLFAAAKTGGIRNYFVEVENMEDTKASYPYLHQLTV